MALIKNKNTEQDREFWSHVESVAKEVDQWPAWMGGQQASSDSLDGSDETQRENLPKAS